MMKSILIIEDSKSDQFLGEMMIKSVFPDIDICLATDGQEGLEILTNEAVQPDVILLDINMPRMNGHEFLKEFSEGNSREVPVVIMLTSSDQEQDKQQAMQYTCVRDYFLKPITKEKVAELQKILDNA